MGILKRKCCKEIDWRELAKDIRGRLARYTIFLQGKSILKINGLGEEDIV